MPNQFRTAILFQCLISQENDIRKFFPQEKENIFVTVLFNSLVLKKNIHLHFSNLEKRKNVVPCRMNTFTFEWPVLFFVARPSS